MRRPINQIWPKCASPKLSFSKNVASSGCCEGKVKTTEHVLAVGRIDVFENFSIAVFPKPNGGILEAPVKNASTSSKEQNPSVKSMKYVSCVSKIYYFGLPSQLSRYLSNIKYVAVSLCHCSSLCPFSTYTTVSNNFNSFSKTVLLKQLRKILVLYLP